MNATIIHKNFMMRCLQLAEPGIRKAAPNPSVGAVLVYKNRIIGEGSTQVYGGKHAEIACIESVTEADRQFINQGTMYVSLEPCMHFGKTPPCTNFIIKHKIPKMVIGIEDPNPKMEGKSIEQLKAAGIDVVESVLKKECEWLNRRYFFHNKTNKPYVVLKYAQTQNGFFAPDDDKQQWISNEMTTRLSHKVRSENQAILVGKNTAVIDNPQLTTRYNFGLSPIRVVIDKNLETPQAFHLYDNSANTIIFNQLKQKETDNVCLVKIDFEDNVILQILEYLGSLNIQSLTVEGGAKTLQHFINGNYWNEAIVVKGAPVWKTGIAAPNISGKKIDGYNLGSDEVVHLLNCSTVLIPN